MSRSLGADILGPFLLWVELVDAFLVAATLIGSTPPPLPFGVAMSADLVLLVVAAWLFGEIASLTLGTGYHCLQA